MKNKVTSIEDAVKLVKDGDSIFIAGFLAVGSAVKLAEALEKTDVKDLTLISFVSESPFAPETVIGKLVTAGKVKRFIGAHIGTSKEHSKQFLSGQMQVDFIPMGTLAEMIHAGGAGLGGVLTPVGVGTQQEDTYKKVEVEGKEYLLYPPLRANVALITGAKIDTFGNVYTRGTARNSALQMALAADTVIAEANEIVEVGAIKPDDVEVPGVLVDHVVQGMNPEENREFFVNIWERAHLLKEAK